MPFGFGLGFSPTIGGGKGGVPFVPGALSGLAAWYDPSDAATVTLNVLDVASITDKSGNSRTASQGTAAQQPLYDLAAINSKNAITYTGANNDVLALASALGMTNAVAGFTFAAVVRQASFAAGSPTLIATTAAGGNRFATSIGSSGTISLATRRLDADTADTKSSVAALTAGVASFTLFSVDYATGTITLVVDGTTRTQTAAWTAGAASQAANSAAAPSIGRAGASILTGTLGEMLAYNRALTSGEIAQLRGYLKPKWGLP